MGGEINILLGLLVLLVAAAGAQNDKCDNEKCGWGSTCKMVNGRPKCRCNEFCPMVHKPVCGSDGKTYTNYCGLKQAGCHQQEEIVKVEDGECPKIVTESAEAAAEAAAAAAAAETTEAAETLGPSELRRPRGAT